MSDEAKKPDSDATLIIECPNASSRFTTVWLNGVDISQQICGVEFLLTTFDNGKPIVKLLYRGSIDVRAEQPRLEEVGK